MTTYVCVEVNTLKQVRIKAVNFKKAVAALLRQVPNATNPRSVGKTGSKEVFIHYNDGPRRS